LKVFVTGHLGMIGNLGVVPILEEKGIEWFGYDIIDGRDILSFRLLAEKMKGYDAVIHLAAIPTHHVPGKSPEDYYSINLLGTYNVFCAAEINHVKKVIFPSSMAVYGDPLRIKYVPIDMNHPTIIDWHGEEPYGMSKLIAEKMIRGFPFIGIVLRLGSVNEHRPWVTHCPIGEIIKIHPRDVGIACYKALTQIEENKLIHFCKPKSQEVVDKAIEHIQSLGQRALLDGWWPYPHLEIRQTCTESLFDLTEAKKLLETN